MGDGRLRVGEVRVVWVWAVAPGAVWDACFGSLSAGEQARALRMREGTARNEFVTGRAVLRVLLGQALGVAARKVPVRTGVHGKPEVDGCPFSVAHARGLIGLAFSDAGAVGLDVERIDRTVEAMEIAEAHFAEAEVAALRGSDDANAAFFELWTRKEAAGKAVGVGLAAGLLRSNNMAGDWVDLEGETVYFGRLRMGEIAGAELWVGHVALAGARPTVQMEVLEAADLLMSPARPADKGR